MNVGRWLFGHLPTTRTAPNPNQITTMDARTGLRMTIKSASRWRSSEKIITGCRPRQSLRLPRNGAERNWMPRSRPLHMLLGDG